jgi:hypothetical protein
MPPLETTQLAVGDFDLQLIEQISDLFRGHIAFLGDLEGYGARDFAVLGRIFQFGNDLFFFQSVLPPQKRLGLPARGESLLKI